MPAELRQISFTPSSSLDQYIRRSDAEKITKGWANGVFQYENIFLKKELDWNQTYLARKGMTYDVDVLMNFNQCRNYRG